MSICEKQMNKDIDRAIISSKNLSTSPSLSSVEKTLVSLIKDILEYSKAIQKENKQIKDDVKGKS